MFRRQDPVSCFLCRRKKLRCSRQQPCSNCVARGVPCERECKLPSSSTSSDQSTNKSLGAKSVSSADAPDVVTRLQRLEDLLLRVDAKVSTTINVHTPSSGGVYSTQQHTPSDSRYVTAANDTEVAHKTDTHILDNVGTKDNRLLMALSNELTYQIIHTSDIPAWRISAESSRSIALPFRTQAVALVSVYQQHIEYLHHVTYSPHVYRTLNQVYDAVEGQSTPSPSSAALLLGIFASSAALQFAIAPCDYLFGISSDEAHAASTVWAKGALDCLDHSRRLGLISLEDLQAVITIFFLMYNLEGFSTRSRGGMASGLATAKDLGLHRIDHPDCSSNLTNKVDREVGRRIWWHMAATDWWLPTLLIAKVRHANRRHRQLSVSGGPQEGTYSVQPRHIATRRPRHIEEEDLETQDENFERPLTVPTASSYFMQRIKLAEICRHITDAMPFGSSGADSTRYCDVLALDGEFQRFLDDLPPFFQNTPQAIEQYKQLYEERPSILVQKYTVNMICQTRRCRLHQPYLVRGFTNPAYAHSRDVCLASARTVIAIKHQVETSPPTAASLLALSGVHHHMFFAAVALVMDLCFNKGTDNSAVEAARRAEVSDALRILEQAKDRSLVARRFLDSLMDVMRKHKVKLRDTTSTSGGTWLPPKPPAALESAPHIGQPSAAITAVHGTPPPLAAQTSVLYADTLSSDVDVSVTHETNDQSDFDEIWQSYIEHGPNFDVPDWDELFTDLQMHMK